jgi:hypothetical protein
VPVNVFDEVDQLPQDLSVADVRHLPFLKDHANPQQRLVELFGCVVQFDPEGRPLTTKTSRIGKKELEEYVCLLRYHTCVCFACYRYLMLCIYSTGGGVRATACWPPGNRSAARWSLCAVPVLRRSVPTTKTPWLCSHLVLAQACLCSVIGIYYYYHEANDKSYERAKRQSEVFFMQGQKNNSRDRLSVCQSSNQI